MKESNTKAIAVDAGPCVFCQYKENKIDSIPAHDKEQRKYFIYCKVCGAAGPMAYNPQAAAKLWNRQIRWTKPRSQ